MTIRVDGTGTRRRIQGMNVMGYSSVDIAARLRCARNTICELREQDTVSQEWHDRIKALANELDALPVPRAYGNRRTRLRAERQGFVHLWAWDGDSIDDPDALPDMVEDDPSLVDQVAVQRRLRGIPVNLTLAERLVVQRLGGCRSRNSDSTRLRYRKPKFRPAA